MCCHDKGARAALAGAASTRRKRLQKSQMEQNWETVKLMVRRHLNPAHDDLNQQKNHKTEDVSMIRHSCYCFWNKCWPWQEYKWPLFFCWRSVCVVTGKRSHTIPALLLPLRYGALEEKQKKKLHLSWFAEQKNDHLPLQTAVHLCSWPDIGLHKLLWWPPPQLRSPGVGALLGEKQRDGIKRPQISPGFIHNLHDGHVHWQTVTTPAYIFMWQKNWLMNQKECANRWLKSECLMPWDEALLVTRGHCNKPRVEVSGSFWSPLPITMNKTLSTPISTSPSFICLVS